MNKNWKNGWNWRQWIKDKGLEKWFRRDNLIILVLSGILLFIIALPTENKNKDSSTDRGDNTSIGSELPEITSGSQEGVEVSQGMTDAVYAAWLEQRLTETLAQVAGVGEVRVMITLSSSSELVIEREKPVTRSATNEADSQGGTRVINQVETGDSVVYRSEGSDSEPYVIKTLPPQIEGVLVVAEGAGSTTVNRTIITIVQALFDVESHKVSVVRMETK
ncbi:MAG: stage III sporulation protein AG [Acetatifactor sp.]|nr:stage III sporulation protein AG [Acetatifactor sp.]